MKTTEKQCLFLISTSLSVDAMILMGIIWVGLSVSSPEPANLVIPEQNPKTKGQRHRLLPSGEDHANYKAGRCSIKDAEYVCHVPGTVPGAELTNGHVLGQFSTLGMGCRLFVLASHPNRLSLHAAHSSACLGLICMHGTHILMRYRPSIYYQNFICINSNEFNHYYPVAPDAHLP